jgi:integrase
LTFPSLRLVAKVPFAAAPAAWSEAAGLKVKRVDLMRRRVTVAETLGEIGGRLVWGTPKNHQAREVYFPGFLADLLAEVVAGRDQDDLVFTTWHGRPLRNLTYSTGPQPTLVWRA